MNKQKTTTQHCRQFLVQEVTKNPAIIHDVWNDQTTAIQEAKTESCWRREAKFKGSNTNHRYALDEYRLWNWGQVVPKVDIAWVRVFCLDPAQFDDSVKFLVLEDHNGSLMLGDYIGD